MELKEVKYILAIAKYKNISRAADALYISQPSLSKYLQNMERNLGVHLFSRIGNEFIPTYMGERYLYYAKQIVDISNEWDKEFADLKDSKEGRMTIAIPLMRSSCIVPATLPLFYKRYPHIKVEIREDTHSVEENTLLSEDVDIAIYNPNKIPSSFDYEVLGTEEIILLAASNHPLKEKGIYLPGCRFPWIDLKEFHQDPFILHAPEQNTGRVARILLEEAGLIPNILLNTRNTQVAAQLAASGVGISFAPESYYRETTFKNPPVCFSIGNPNTKITLVAAYKKGRYLPRYILDYLDLIKEYLKDFSLDL